MKVAQIRAFGGPEVLLYEDAAMPRPQPDELLIRVHACALNHLDLWVRSGALASSAAPFPHILGSDLAGEIVEVGERASEFRSGQRVLVAPMHFCNRCAYCASGQQNRCATFTVRGNGINGSNREMVAVPAIQVIPIPDDLDYNRAASVPLVFLTAWHMLVGRARIRQGQSVLIIGAASGVGVAAVQIAKLFHARVIATAGTEHKLERAHALGADFGINHYRQSISDEVQKFTDGEGVDIVFEHVGGATWDESIQSLKYGGTVVTCGATTEGNVGLDLRRLYRNQLSILGAYLGTMGELRDVLSHVFAGRLKAVVDKTFPLSDVRRAHEYMEKSRMFGKIVLNPQLN